MSMHIQNNGRAVARVEEAVRLLPQYALVKAVLDPAFLAWARAINPGITTLYRLYLPEDQQRFGNSQAEAEGLARAFFDRMLRDFEAHRYMEHIDLVEEYNEYLPWYLDAAGWTQRLRWMEAAARVWATEYRGRWPHRPRLVIANQSVGNDLPRAVGEIALAYDCVISYHAYDHYIAGERDGGSWRWHSGRWSFMEQAWGLQPDWIHSECGPYFDAKQGWKSGQVANGHLPTYLHQTRLWLQDTLATPAYRGGRHYGYALFTSGPDYVGWHQYQTRGEELVEQARLARELWRPAAPVPGPAPQPGAGYPVQTTRRWWLRRVPDWTDQYGHSGIVVLPAGARLQVVGEEEGAEYNGSTGWLRVEGRIHKDGARRI